ncbi:MAG: hypothetical protein HC799_13965 [Limnothrix sp. RL_2_0]|nr:hypothetical protein [Limnothrix sp. RL_2_0]
MKYSAAFSLAAIAMFSTQLPSLAHHDTPSIVTHHTPTVKVSHHQPSVTTAKVSAISADATPGMLGLRGLTGREFQVICPAGNTTGSVWGTDIYSDGSSICAAAIHAGKIDSATGGSVKFEMLGEQSAFFGGDRHGVSTNSYGAWGGSFQFK